MMPRLIIMDVPLQPRLCIVCADTGLWRSIGGCASVEAARCVAGSQHTVHRCCDIRKGLRPTRVDAEVRPIRRYIPICNLLEDVQRAQIQVTANWGHLVAVIAPPGKFR